MEEQHNMAQKVSVETVDDLDGISEANVTIRYSFDGTYYEIDLSNKNADLFRKDMRSWIDHSRVIPAPKGRTRRIAAGEEDLTAIREWAHSQGIAVAPRGRVARTVVAAYRDRKLTCLPQPSKPPSSA